MNGLFGGEELSPQGKLLVLVSFLAQDGVITRNAQCLLKALILKGDKKVLSLLKHLEAGEAGGSLASKAAASGASGKNSGGFIKAVYSSVDDFTVKLFNELFKECSLEVAKKVNDKDTTSLSLSHLSHNTHKDYC
jgi:hypothetical protein